MVGEDGGKAAAKGTWHEGLKVFTDILLPAGAGLAGFFSITPVLGGVNSFYNVLLKAGITGNAGRLADLIMAGITAAIGFCFWHLRSSGNLILKIVGNGVGGYFLGGAASFAAQAWTQPSGVPNGFIDHLVANLETVAQES
ncbi:MAG: hypothetical protein L3K23_10665 [Thermoplasmata archaeon]|nr:hypothetical protein [Thermoplasmata archaeon]